MENDKIVRKEKMKLKLLMILAGIIFLVCTYIVVSKWLLIKGLEVELEKWKDIYPAFF